MVTAPRTKQNQEISDPLLRELKNNVASRQVSKGIALLDAHAHLFSSIDPEQKNAAGFVGYVAQWVDIGYREPALVEKLLSRFSKGARAHLPVGDYLQLRMAEGLLALLHDEPDEALVHFDLVLSMQQEIQEKELVAIAQFWNGRCHRKKGEYDEALKHATVGRELAMSLGFEKMAAVMRVLESWMLFQKGHPREAARILDQAVLFLQNTDAADTYTISLHEHGRSVGRQ